jgi:crossover junction endodeoxyribonuclease RuvC
LAYITEDTVNVIPFSPGLYNYTLRKISEMDKAICCLEHVSAMPGQGVTSMFNFGQNFGWIQGLLEAHGIPYELVRPQKWKKEFSITGDKNSSIAVCKRLFPDVSLLPTERCRKDNDGMAEALLLCEYARRHM